MENKYIHDEKVHNLSDPMEIVPHVLELLKPKNVVDIGCGLGTFLYCFKQGGVNEILGVDGSWVDKKMLHKYITPEEFQEEDLEKPISLKKKYDLSVSLEVAEHISEQSADIFVSNLVSAGKVVLFSAALPNQGGQNHINEQWLTYWEEKFLENGYILHDVIRPRIWDNEKIFWWYRQNMVIFAPRDFVFSVPVVYNPIKNIVHYELFKVLNKRIDDLTEGRDSGYSYLKYLVKSVIGSQNISRLKSNFSRK